MGGGECGDREKLKEVPPEEPNPRLESVSGDHSLSIFLPPGILSYLSVLKKNVDYKGRKQLKK